MVTTNQDRMLGVTRQPHCGKCCGEDSKRGNTKQKRAERRHVKQLIQIEGFKNYDNN